MSKHFYFNKKKKKKKTRLQCKIVLQTNVK